MLTLTAWHWLIFACILFAIEMLVPGTFLLWIGLAAFCSAVIKAVIPNLSIEIELLLFAIFCILSMVGWWQFNKNKKDDENLPKLNQRNQLYLNRILTLSEAIKDGYGKVIVDDTIWKVRGTDAAKGAKVKVVDVEGNTLIVEVLEP